MSYQTGRLVEISPWGTGFVQCVDEVRYGFHTSMLKSDSNLADLENKPVLFRTDGKAVVEVLVRTAEATTQIDNSAVTHKATA